MVVNRHKTILQTVLIYVYIQSTPVAKRVGLLLLNIRRYVCMCIHELVIYLMGIIHSLWFWEVLLIYSIVHVISASEKMCFYFWHWIHAFPDIELFFFASEYMFFWCWILTISDVMSLIFLIVSSLFLLVRSYSYLTTCSCYFWHKVPLYSWMLLIGCLVNVIYKNESDTEFHI
jgi:hypothetical protein